MTSRIRAPRWLLGAALGAALLAYVALRPALGAAEGTDLGALAAEMSGAASALLESLEAPQSAKLNYSFDDAERQNWHFIPRQRSGLALKDMTAEQRKAALALLRTGLSAQGYDKASAIMALEQVLAELEGPGRSIARDPQLYHVWLFGRPGAGNTWGWRFEGHHLSLSFTIAAGKAVSGAPAFFGSNPARVASGPSQGLRVLGSDEDAGRQLARSLREEQRAGIIAAQAPSDIVLRPEGVAKQGAKPFDPAGVSFAALDEGQRAQLRALVQQYADRHRTELAAQDLAKIEAAGWERVSFAWAGGLEPGAGHYYRIQGPTFVIEYDNTQNEADHIHSIWHDPDDNFGAQILRQHLQQSHGG
jgi:hypothetical protein